MGEPPVPTTSGPDQQPEQPGQQWGQPAQPAQQWGQPGQPVAQPPTQPAQQWGQPNQPVAQPPAQPAHQWGQPNQPAAQPPAQPAQQWGQPDQLPTPQPWGQPNQPAAAPPVLPVNVPPVPTPPQQQFAPQAPSGQSMYGVRPEPPQPQAVPGQGAFGQGAFGQSVGQGAFGQFTFPTVSQQPLEPMAVAGVATSVLGVVGVVLGLLARGRIRKNGRRSMKLAWTAVVVGGVFTIVWAMVLTVMAFNGTIARAFESPQPGDIDEPRTIASANLAVGNCVATLPPAATVGELRLVPCATEHIAQVVSEHELSGDYPTDLEQQAADTCQADVEAIDSGDTAIGSWYLVPSEEGWQQGNTRIVCLLRGAAGTLTEDFVN